MDLIIVESPTKAKTISQFLGENFKIASSNGHIRDLPKGKMGIDIENDFQPHYVIPTKKRKIVTQLKKLAKQAEKIILATDEDREGESIAWHLKEILKQTGEKKFERITFHEITPLAIKNALKNPRDIDINLVHSQQARRILDRLFGYELSPILWKKVANRLSAGRVQSPALRLIVEREKQRKAFKPEEYWTITTFFQTKPVLKAELKKINNKPIKKPGLSKKEAEEIIKELENNKFVITDIKEQIVKRQPKAPFITSSLEIEANKKLNFSANKTMRIAQKLYEGIEIKKGVLLGLISYIRTDSFYLNEEFLKNAEDFIKKNFGEKYSKKRQYKTKNRLAQQAHEAIRPTNLNYPPEKIKDKLTKDEYNLYKLIWERTLASQMAEAEIKVKKISIQTQDNKYTFRTQAQDIVFPGFLIISSEKKDIPLLPENLEKNQELKLKKIEPTQHFTQPPPRYNDASLIKELESLGIGRPSTYGPIIKTLEQRNYIQRKNNYFLPQEIGEKVNEILVKHFPDFVDYSFTAELEKKLDNIAEKKQTWVEVVREFYENFKQTLEKEKEKIANYKEKPKILDEKCPLCQSNLTIKTSRFGKFIACSNFPSCKYTRPIETFGPCPRCKKGLIVKKRNKRGKEFYACSLWPECDYITKEPPSQNKKN
ncbi:type I DNA topoisomerase [bacterium]|nr:type I DNA topoisomerase [bacterium]